MSLQNLQADFAEELNNGGKQSLVVHPPKYISIYQNNMLANLTQALQDIYPLITKLVGADFFRSAAKEYINHYPSRSGDLHDYGAYFSDFLANYPPVHDLIYLAEAAQFEWACHNVFFAADHPAFDIKILENFSQDIYENLRFTLHPASALIKFHYPILRIIDLCKGDIDDNIDIGEGGVNLLILRRHLDLSLIALSNADFTFLEMLNDSKSLSESLNTTLMIDMEFKLENKLSSWIQDKIIVDCYVSAIEPTLHSHNS